MWIYIVMKFLNIVFFLQWVRESLAVTSADDVWERCCDENNLSMSCPQKNNDKNAHHHRCNESINLAKVIRSWSMVIDHIVYRSDVESRQPVLWHSHTHIRICFLIVLIGQFRNAIIDIDWIAIIHSILDMV